MANLIIGGNTYKNVNRVQIKNTDGTTATFIDSTTNTLFPRGAFVSAILGVTGIVKTVSSVVVNKIPKPTGTITLN